MRVQTPGLSPRVLFVLWRKIAKGRLTALEKGSKTDGANPSEAASPETWCSRKGTVQAKRAEVWCSRTGTLQAQIPNEVSDELAPSAFIWPYSRILHRKSGVVQAAPAFFFAVRLLCRLS